MTTQIHDTVEWNATKYLLVALDGPPPFEPFDHGLRANWQWWLLVFPGAAPPALLGVQSVSTGGLQFEYRGLEWEVDFEGGRLTGARELSSEMRKLRADIDGGRAKDPDDSRNPGWIERTFRVGFLAQQRKISPR